MTIEKLAKLGLFTAIALAAVIATIFMIGKNKNWFRKKLVLSGEFENVSGLATGARVQLSGVIIGEVTEMYVSSDTSVSVKISVDARYRYYIRRDAALSVGTDGLIGNKVINILPGTPQTSLVRNQDTLQTYTPIQMDLVMNKFQTVVYNAADITGDLAGILGSLRRGEGPLGSLLVDSTMSEDLKQTLRNLNKGSRKLDQNLEAAKHNILFRGYFRNKEKEKKERK